MISRSIKEHSANTNILGVISFFYKIREYLNKLKILWIQNVSIIYQTFFKSRTNPSSVIDGWRNPGFRRFAASRKTRLSSRPHAVKFLHVIRSLQISLGKAPKSSKYVGA
jgi:hypothetical protein